MPAGDQITGDWQVEIQALLTGDTTDYEITQIDGLAKVPIKVQDYDRSGADGSVPGDDYLGPRLIGVHYEIIQASKATAFNRLTTLTAAWDPVTTSSDPLELHLQVPGWGHSSVVGRPRGFGDEDLSRAGFGFIAVLAEFYCPDPTITKGL